jgi:putative tryptophan/tyrosine transport system substrate-binding protein
MAMGLVESLSRPGRNATGFSDILAELSGKFVDLAREVIKPQTTVDYLWHTAWPDGQNRHHATEQAAQAAGMKLRSKGIADIAELDDALRAIKQSGSTTLIVQPSPFHLRATRTDHRISDEEWTGDDILLCYQPPVRNSPRSRRF